MGYYIFIIALIAALGGYVYGVDAGTISSTVGHEPFLVYMLGSTGKNASLLGAIVSLYNTGQVIGTVVSGYSADKLSRRWTICGAAFTSVCGDLLQTIAQEPAMMIAGRFLSGCACGVLLSVVPIYMAEVSPPKQRGFIVGLQGMTISIGYMLANWVGYFTGWASGNLQWRVALAVQIPGPLALFLGCFFIPYSPLWLIEQQRYDEAKTVLLALHKSHDENLLKEFTQIRNQIELERDVTHLSWLSAIGELFSRKYIRRTATASFILIMVQLSGSNVIQNYQNLIYGTVGFKGQEALLIGGAYGAMGVLGQIIYLVFVADRWPRSRTLWVGSIFLCATMSASLALSSLYHGGDPNILSRVAIAFVFLYSCGYAVFFNATVWVVPSELFPFFLRSKGLGFAVLCRSIFGIIFSQITPISLQEISWRYYFLFVATNILASFVYFFFLPETRGKSLEEVAEIFGDELAINQSEGESLDSLEKLTLSLERVDIEKEAGLFAGAPIINRSNPRLAKVGISGLYRKGDIRTRRDSVARIAERGPTYRNTERRSSNHTKDKLPANHNLEKKSTKHTANRRTTTNTMEMTRPNRTLERNSSSRIERRYTSPTAEQRTSNRNTERRSTNVTANRRSSQPTTKPRIWKPERTATNRMLERGQARLGFLRSTVAVPPTGNLSTLDYPVLNYPTLGFARGLDGQTFFLD